ncbi:FAD-binding oxidoreductase [Janibacter cremeus]|uniref:hybrid-cluster NAD(P)-dependent oxidoreductase n=1 Tax=Janibacter cremeus TaxID=1285192 RepID=UPI0023F6A62B|nr:hybrid-cluster NAD(P)-dependent oxidoreductase [Janibacter cremeus]WEV78847.1 FAD-binding oxidoreductase [Janibacter cremeus]
MTDMLVRPATRAGADPREGAWTDTIDGPLTCTAVVDVTHDVRTFTFAPPAGRLLRFLPGQYLTFSFVVDGRPVSRCYTISSAPTRPELLEITVKRVPGGVVSPWLHEHLRPGDVVEASGPCGQFSHELHPADSHLFLTAGSGITPAMSMLRTLCDTGAAADVVLVHCARTPDDIVYRSELAQLSARHGVAVAVLCEEDSPGEHWDGLRGRLDAAALRQVAPDLRRREVFTCGPPPFMAAVRELLEGEGGDPRRAHEESFVLEGAMSTGRSTADDPSTTDGRAAADSRAAADDHVGADRVAATYRLELRRSGRVVECDGESTILEAALRAGVTLPSSCEEGMCGTCKLTLLDGRVDMQHAGGIRPREVAQGKILPCCSTPLEDVVVDA